MPPTGRLYLDHSATSPLRPEARAAMERALGEAWGNPSSVHSAGRAARDAVERARCAVASLVGAAAGDIVFTSGGTEGNHVAIRGLAIAATRSGRSAHVVSSPIEHPSVAGALETLRQAGFEVALLPVDGEGRISSDPLRRAMREDTALVSLAIANHEIGNLFPVGEFARVAHEARALFHTDAVQAAGKVPLDLVRTEVDAATLSAHKIGGPPGVGAVFVRPGLDLPPLTPGGHQERERRPGTENVVGIVGFGAAAAAARAGLADESTQLGRLRDELQARLLGIPRARVHGDCAPAGRVPGTLNVGFEGARGDHVLAALDLDGICVSTGAACSSGSVAPSPVLLALGLAPEVARTGVRFSLGPGTTAEDVARVADAVSRVVERVRTPG